MWTKNNDNFDIAMNSIEYEKAYKMIRFGYFCLMAYQPL